MTQLRHCKCGSTNTLDLIERGVGLRGSSFTDLDAVSHDGPTHRFLGRELKRPNEPLDQAQRIFLMDLALEPRWTVWYLQFWNADQIAWADMLHPDSIDVITVAEYRERLRAWWENRYELGRYIDIAEEIHTR